MPIRSFITLAALLAAVAFPASAGATTAADCQTQIADLGTETALVTTFAHAKDQTGLLEKLDNASTALTLGKNAGAIAKLEDFRVKVQALGAATKLGADDAAQLDADAADVIRCIEDIGV